MSLVATVLRLRWSTKTAFELRFAGRLWWVLSERSGARCWSARIIEVTAGVWGLGDLAELRVMERRAGCFGTLTGSCTIVGESWNTSDPVAAKLCLKGDFGLDNAERLMSFPEED